MLMLLLAFLDSRLVTLSNLHNPTYGSVLEGTRSCLKVRDMEAIRNGPKNKKKEENQGDHRQYLYFFVLDALRFPFSLPPESFRLEQEQKGTGWEESQSMDRDLLFVENVSTWRTPCFRRILALALQNLGVRLRLWLRSHLRKDLQYAAMRRFLFYPDRRSPVFSSRL